ncbi:MAG: hypothetical protein J6J24_02045 [Clostridia bacterium]|nr:hypothetical protein [Clostridia bacterium]
MKEFIKNLMLYISAFVPMYCLVLVKLVIEIVNQNLSFTILNTVNLTTLLLLIAVGTVGLFFTIRCSKGRSIKIRILSKNNITDQHFLGYFSLFVFFAIPLDLSLVSAYCVYLLVLIMIGIVYINNSLYYINPLLNLLGYNFYDVEYEEGPTGEKMQAKFFFKGESIKVGQTYMANIKNPHFAFLSKNEKVDVDK